MAVAEREPWYNRLLEAESVNYIASWITIVSALTAAAFNSYLLYRLVYAHAASKSSNLDLLLIPSISTLVLLIVLIFLSLSYRRKLIRLGEKNADIARLEEQFENSRKINADIARYRTLIAHAHYYFCNELNEQVGTPDPKRLGFKLQQYLDQVLDNASRLFTFYTTDSCSACVKILSQTSDGKLAANEDAPAEYVLTLRRDPGSRQLRRGIDSSSDCSVYRYQDNAAFFNIIARPELPDFFIENDLKALGASYWNKNPNWHKNYNATAVFPIKRPGSSASNQCAAFLCVDNFKGGFDHSRCKWILEGIAIDLYYAIRTYLVLSPNLERGMHDA